MNIDSKMTSNKRIRLGQPPSQAASHSTGRRLCTNSSTRWIARSLCLMVVIPRIATCARGSRGNTAVVYHIHAGPCAQLVTFSSTLGICPKCCCIRCRCWSERLLIHCRTSVKTSVCKLCTARKKNKNHWTCFLRYLTLRALSQEISIFSHLKVLSLYRDSQLQVTKN